MVVETFEQEKETIRDAIRHEVEYAIKEGETDVSIIQRILNVLEAPNFVEEATAQLVFDGLRHAGFRRQVRSTE